MKNFKEFKTRIESDTVFAIKFKDAETDEQIIALAKAEGYDLEQLDEEDLEAIAGGGLGDFFKGLWEGTKKIFVSIAKS